MRHGRKEYLQPGDELVEIVMGNQLSLTSFKYSAISGC